MARLSAVLFSLSFFLDFGEDFSFNFHLGFGFSIFLSCPFISYVRFILVHSHIWKFIWLHELPVHSNFILVREWKFWPHFQNDNPLISHFFGHLLYNNIFKFMSFSLFYLSFKILYNIFVSHPIKKIFFQRAHKEKRDKSHP